MKCTMSKSDFLNMWPKSREDQFSYAALLAMYAWYEEYEESCGEEVEYDPIAFCCEWTEYANAIEACDDHGLEYEVDPDDEGATEDSAMDALQGETMVIPFNGGILMQNW